MPDAKHYETDVAIVGGGGAGIAAGIEARDAGARAITFENSSRVQWLIANSSPCCS